MANRKAKKAGVKSGSVRAKTVKAKTDDARSIEKTADGHYIIIEGRRWRATDPSIPEDKRKELVVELMKARRDVGRSLGAGDETAEREARGRVNRLKTALGERGPKWWEKQGSEKTRR